MSTSNVAVEVKAPVKVNVEDNVDVAESALVRFVLSSDTSSVAQDSACARRSAVRAVEPLGHRPLEAATRLP